MSHTCKALSNLVTRRIFRELAATEISVKIVQKVVKFSSDIKSAVVISVMPLKHQLQLDSQLSLSHDLTWP